MPVSVRICRPDALLPPPRHRRLNDRPPARLDLLDSLDGAQQRDAAAWKNTFFHRRPGRMHGVIDAILALL